MKLIHVIGLVGAGKSRFIRNFFPASSVFDVKYVYEEFGFTPEDLKDRAKYNQFANAISFSLGGFIRQYQEEKFIFVESSGINQAINGSLKRFPHSTLLVSSSYPATVEKSRPYAKSLNSQITTNLENKTILFDGNFDGDLQELSWGTNLYKITSRRQLLEILNGIL